jgi:TetR/AcrR family transcriptional repressor of nem operon
MARPREFEAEVVLSAAMQCFWARGYEATSVRDLVKETGITAASLYNAFGDKRALFRAALNQYIDRSVGDRIRRCEALPAREAIQGFFQDILNRSLSDRERKGCLLVNSALEVAPHDAQFQEIIGAVLRRVEAFFLKCIEAGQADGTIARSSSAPDLARHLLGVLMGVRVLARVRPEKALLEGVIRPALSALEPVGRRTS